MSTCMARRGFLTLSDCGNTAVTACSNCGRMMCPTHLSPTSGFTMCLDCAATTTPAATNPQGQEEYDDVWAHRYRNNYYSSTHYTPYYMGSRHDSYYDSQDVRSFDDRDQRLLDDDDRDAGSFGQS